MQHGDLSNKVSPRVLLVYEGAVGLCIDKAKHDKAIKKGNWAKALTYWRLNEAAVARILYQFHKKDITFELVTFIGEYFAIELHKFMDEQDIPFHRVWWSTPQKLGRAIAYMPDLAYVYDPEPTRWIMYGSKGRFLSNVNQIGDWT